MRLPHNKFAPLLTLLASSCIAEPAAAEIIPDSGGVYRLMTVASMPAVICFTTGNHSTEGADCAAVVADEIAMAKTTLLVQAYNFTEPHIIQAIIDAHTRGVNVTVILDKISPTQKGEGADPLKKAGIPVYIDKRPKIAHNKVMIIDSAAVITGSFNFSSNAECCNAENLIVLHAPVMAEIYGQNFANRLLVSTPY